MIDVPSPSARVRAGRQRPLLALRRLHRDQRGSAAIEFAVIAPVFFFLMFVIAETALVFIAEQVMDNAVFETARLVRTGQVQKGGMSADDFREEVCGRMSVFVDCDGDDFYLDVKSYPNFTAMSFNSPTKVDGTFQNEPAPDFGEESEIIVMRAYYKWSTAKIPFVGGTLATPGLNGKRLIGAFAAFKNEPFGKT